MIDKNTKISGAGWLCVLRDGHWFPLFKLTEAQLAETKKFLESDWAAI